MTAIGKKSTINKFRTMKRIFSSLLIAFIICFSTNSWVIAYSSDPEKFISEIIEEAKIILNSEDTKQIKAEKLSAIAINTVDVKGIGYYTFAKKEKKFPDQKKKYEDLFEDYFRKVLLKIDYYSDPKISVLSAEKINEKYTIVKSMLLKTDKKPEVKID